MWELDHISDMWSIDVDTCNTETTAEFEQLVHQRSTSARETKDLAEKLQRLQAEAQEEVIRRQSTKADRTRELAQIWQSAASIRGLSNITQVSVVLLLRPRMDAAVCHTCASSRVRSALVDCRRMTSS